ncbi:glycoside hydrolase family 44 protein [Jiulongibacter sp. NS-SX5]|uniref:glycoside hydrolase family 44 protein n=1 Tax=Jiulongibacter sp. NS-SX5 TaxID=3463854 RepID=UPI0040591CD8
MNLTFKPALACLAGLFLFVSATMAQVTISIDTEKDTQPYSRYIFGRNNSFSSTNPTWQLPQDDILRMKDAGVTFFREGGGNNSTKYNWRRKLSSHPDWYNNVYTNDWDNVAQQMQSHFTDVQGMWSFQLIGKAASSTSNNFNDWEFNGSQWWEGTRQNLAGGGQMAETGTEALVDGDIDLYLEDWNADSTTGIIDHWFGAGGLGINQDQVLYWNMDNEPEIWGGTHDDVMKDMVSAEEYMQRYFAVAKKAREKFPDIKLVGPVPANEWQWYNWFDGTVKADGREYPWLEYFIKRIAEEEKASGIRLLDVLDIHFYPGENAAADIVQLHRVYFDRNYVYPGANGVKKVNGGWDNSQTKEYIFGRISDWLNVYLGAGHGVTLGVTETSINSEESNLNAVWYASLLGEFMKNGVEILTPWDWRHGMWETLYAFNKYRQKDYLETVSSDDNRVSAYTTMNNTKDTLNVILVNKNTSGNTSVTLDFENFFVDKAASEAFQIANLPQSETFFSADQNAQKQMAFYVTGSTLTASLPSLSVSTMQLVRGEAEIALALEKEQELILGPNPAKNTIKIYGSEIFKTYQVLSLNGQRIRKGKVSSENRIRLNVPSGTYLLQLKNQGKLISRKIVVH